VDINGKEAVVSADGSFTAYNIKLSQGINQITAQASNQGGQTDEDAVQVTYEPPSGPLSTNLLSLENGAIIETPYFKVVGTVTDPEATVLVNDTIATVDEDGFYSASVYACEEQVGSRRVARCDDCYLEGVLPFPFVLQGTTFTRYTTSSNGGIELLPEAGYFQLEDDFGDATDMIWWYYDATMIFASFDDLSSSDYGSFGTRHIRPGYRDINGNVITEEAFMFYWRTETYADEGSEYLNYFEVLLYPDGRIKWNFDRMDFRDYGYEMYSGIYNGLTGLNLEVGRAITSNRSFVMLPSAEKVEEIGKEWVAHRGGIEWGCPLTTTTYSKDGQTISSQTITYTYIPVQEPFTVTISNSSPGSTVTSSPLKIQGKLHDVLSAVSATVVTVNGYDAVVNGDAYSSSVPLTDGINYITVHAMNAAGSDAYDTIKVIYEPPAKPLTVQITSPIDNSMVNYPSVPVSGMISDSTALVKVNGIEAEKDFRSFKVSSFPLSIGENIITATATRPTGESANTSIKITYDPNYPSPPPPILGRLPEYATTSYREVSGLTLPWYKVDIFVNGMKKALLTADSSGFFKTAVYLPEEGQNHISARAIDQYGNTGNLSSEAIVMRDTIQPYIQSVRVSTLKWDLFASRVRITGKTEVLAAVNISIDNDTDYQYTVTADEHGEFSISTHLSSGNHFVHITATDKAGNSSAYSNIHPVHSIETGIPASPTIDPIPNPINETPITVEGNAYASFSEGVEIYRNDELVGTAIANSRGRYKLEGVNLMPGTNRLKVRQGARRITYPGSGFIDLGAAESSEMTVDVVSGPPARPQVKIDFPLNGAVTDAEFLPLRGQVDTPGATVRLRGYYCNCYYGYGSARIENGNFISENKIPLLPGENILWVETTAPDGSRGVDKIKVYSRKDVLVPSVRITSPIEDQEVYDQYVTAAGTADSSAQKIIVNEKEAAIRSGTFTTNLVDILSGYQYNPSGYNTMLTAWAMDANGNIGYHDVPLHYKYIPTPQVYINSPFNGEILSTSPATVTGSIYDATEVTVNGVPAQIDGNAFTAQIELREGQYSINVIAKNQIKAMAETIIITYDPDSNITLQSITIESATASVPYGGILQLQAIGTYTNSQTVDLTKQAQWTSSNTNATVNNGLITGESTGSAVITASYRGLSANKTITIGQPILKSIRICYEWGAPGSSFGDGTTYTYSCTNPEMTIGETLQFKAFGYYSDGKLYDLTKMYGTLTWASSNPQIAVINESGLATAITKGTTNITATHQYGGNTVTGTKALTITPEPVYIFITSPANSSTIDKSEATITGTVITQAQEAGVTVNGIPAAIYGNEFVANDIPLQQGSNVITAKAIDSNGATQETQITITASPVANYITLTSNIESGIAPMEAVLKVDGTFSITDSSMTYAYTGSTPPEVTSVSAEEYRVKFIAEGIYYFTANVTDPDGNLYQDTIAITVVNRAGLDTLLKGKWEGMKAKLAAGDVEGAVGFFEERSQETYRPQFTALKPILDIIANEMGQINLVRVEDNSAEYEIIATRNGVTYSYYLLFVRDRDGLWKIKVF